MRYPLILTVLLCVTSQAAGQPYRYEAEEALLNGTLGGTQVSSFVPGYSGTGYVTGFNAPSGTLEDGDYVELNVDVPDGLFEMWVGYRSQYGDKGYYYQVDGEFGSGMFDQSSTFSEDRVGLFNLSGGTNTLGIYQYWGYYDIDYLEFRPFTPPAVLPVSPQLSDPDADAATQFLMNYMSDMYGSKTLSGHQHAPSDSLPFPSSTFLNLSGGLQPAIRASDFIDYSPSRIEFGANPENESEQSIAWAQQTGGILSMSWHWNAPTDLVNDPCPDSMCPGLYPWWRGFYTDGTNFDLPGALADPGGEDYQLILRDIDAIADELQKFEDAGVPVIWRPLHEAQGGWFWWGAHGPDTFKELWNLMHDRMTNVHGLHNLIWEFTSSAAEGDFLDWYPGDDVVDMIGLDIYTDPTSSMSGQWYNILEQYNGQKMIALSESGTLPNADLMDAYGIEWSYYSIWQDDFLDDFTPAEVQALMGDEDIITLDELMLMPWSDSFVALPGDYNGDGTVDAADYTVWRDAQEAGAMTLLNRDPNNSGPVEEDDYMFWREHFGMTIGSGAGAGSVVSPTVPEPGTALLSALAGVGLLLVRRRRVTKLISA